ncbi:hypothetical protein KC19_8G002700 [Ceratodon purpureus]|uniref:Uncharacterized protein n=1 Tax=Ceratodon purpureus TaxID=3225 RepID=A0A8T0GXT2_CERPU|nr:hypothetical protein KC19_8G002700 [Ceratodon purpureus]
MYAASKIWTRTSLRSTHKVSCMNPSLQILHSPSTVYVFILFCEIPSKLLIPQFGEKNTLSSSLSTVSVLSSKLLKPNFGKRSSLQAAP